MAIKSVGINPKRGKDLEKKSIELIIKAKKQVRESEIVNFLIDEMLERVDIDDHGLFIKEEKEEKEEK